MFSHTHDVNRRKRIHRLEGYVVSGLSFKKKNRHKGSIELCFILTKNIDKHRHRTNFYKNFVSVLNNCITN